MSKAANRKAARRRKKLAAIQMVPPELEDDDDDDEPRPLDCITRSLIANGVPLTQRNWIEAGYLGDKHSIEEVDFEDLANNAPEGFEDWPEDELPVN